MDPTPKTTIAQTDHYLFLNEDPNVTISDDNDDRLNHNKDSNQKKCHGRWSNQEQLVFLKNIVSCKDNIVQLVDLLSPRNLLQIKMHTVHFLRMCKKEFAVSKSKRQNKLILDHICNNYGFYPSESYLEQLEEIILNPSMEMMKYLSKIKLVLKKTIKNSTVTNVNVNTTPKKRNSNTQRKKKTEALESKDKEKIFSITKTARKVKVPNVINILTIKVMSNSNNNCQSVNNSNEKYCSAQRTKEHLKQYGPNPFNIEFEPNIMSITTKVKGNVNVNSEDIVNNQKEEQTNNQHHYKFQTNNNYNDNDDNDNDIKYNNDNIVMSNMLLDHHQEDAFNSSINDLDSLN